jgi:MFS family permease
VGFSTASAGDGLLYGAVPLLAVVVDPHPFAVSVVIAADNLPWLLMALPAGHVADRFERGRVNAITNALRASIMFVAVAFLATNRISFPLLLALVLVNATCRAVYYASVQAMVPGLIDTRDLEQANGVLTGTEAGTESLVGPVAGSTLFAAARSLPFLAAGMAFLASCVPLGTLRSKPPPHEGTGRSNSMLEGMRLLLADPRLRVVLLMVGSLSALQGMESGVLVLLATTEWGVRQGAYGLFLAAGGVGAIVGSLVADNVVRRVGGGRALVVAAAASGISYLVMASVKSWVLAAPAFALACFAIGGGSVAAISLRQRLTPDHLMGRVGSAWRGMIWGAAPLGALAAGAIAAATSLATPLFLAGALQCLIALVLARPLLQLLREKSALALPNTNGKGADAASEPRRRRAHAAS